MKLPLTAEQVEHYFDCINPLKDMEWWEGVLNPKIIRDKLPKILVSELQGNYRSAVALSAGGYMCIEETQHYHSTHPYTNEPTIETKAYASLTEKGQQFIALRLL